MNKPTPDEAILANRRAKAAKVHRALLEDGVTPERALAFNVADWQDAAEYAGYDSISEVTRGLVLGMFAERTEPEEPQPHFRKAMVGMSAEAKRQYLEGSWDAEGTEEPWK